MTERQARTTTLIAAALALVAVLKFDLLGALLAGLLVHELVHTIAPGFAFTGGGATRGRLFAIGVLGTLIIAVLVGAVFGILAVLRMEGASPGALLGKLAGQSSPHRDEPGGGGGRRDGGRDDAPSAAAQNDYFFSGNKSMRRKKTSAPSD